MKVRSRLLAVVAAAALLLTACGEGDATRDQLIEMLADPGEPGAQTLSEDQAACIADALFARYDQVELNAIARARTAADLPPGSEQVLRDVTAECVGPAAPAEG
jgi:hypothetical protein